MKKYTVKTTNSPTETNFIRHIINVMVEDVYLCSSVGSKLGFKTKGSGFESWSECFFFFSFVSLVTIKLRK